MDKILLLLIILFVSCQNNSGQNNKIVVEKRNTNVEMHSNLNERQIVKKFYGEQRLLKFPIKFNTNGNRFNDNYRFTQLDEKAFNELSKEIDLSYLEHEDQKAYSIGYIEKGDMIHEFFGFGFNDYGEIDRVNFYIYLASHDSKGNISNVMLVSSASNTNDLVYSEFYMESFDWFNIKYYKFAQNINDAIGEVAPQVIGLKEIRFSFKENGTIEQKAVIKDKDTLINLETDVFDGF